MKKASMYLGIFVGMYLAGCGGTAPATLLPENQVGTAVAETAVVMTVQAVVEATRLAMQPSITPAPTNFTFPTAAPTATQPDSVYVEATNRVRFESGGTRASFTHAIGGGAAQEYLIKALAGQMMEVSLNPAAGGLYLDIHGVGDGAVLLPGASQLAFYRGILPSTQDYSIKVISAGSSHTYGLTIMVPAWIKFAAGTTAKTIYGHVSANNTVDYIIGATTGQTMSVDVTTPGVQVGLSIVGLSDGQPYLRYVAEATSWSMVLPMSQTYRVSVVTIGPATDFTLVVEVVN